MKAYRYWIVFSLTWLLWTHSWPVKNDGSVETWAVDSSYQTQGDCEAAAVKLAGNYDFYIKDRWNLRGKREYKQVCLLDTVNPQEVKEKPKEGSKEAPKEEPKETPKEKQ
jgi:hypothetical protein